MLAAVYEDFGSPDVLRIQEVDNPTPGDSEVLIRVRAASVNPFDWKMMHKPPFPMSLFLNRDKQKMKRIGVDVAGIVEAVGRNITHLSPGDEVFGACAGGFAEYTTTAPVFGLKSVLVKKPANVSFEYAASLPIAGLTALQGLRHKGHVRAGQTVLINGASGGVGTFAVQIAKHLGAHVTGVCSGRNAALVRSLGSDRVIDYEREDFTRTVDRYDIILECVGTPSISDCKRALKSNGGLLLAGAPDKGTAHRIVGAFLSPRTEFFFAKMNEADLTTLAGLVSSGKVKPVIDRTYPLSEAADALRYSATGRARGKIIVTP